MISLVGAVRALKTSLVVSLAASSAWAGPTQDEAASRSWTVFADVVHSSPGTRIENALVRIADGKIVAIAPGASPAKDSLRAAAVTAGMIDLSPRVATNNNMVEQTREVAPDMTVRDSVDPFDRRWLGQAKVGVTTALATPPDRNVVGGLAIVLKTAGSTSLDDRLVQGTPILRGAIGDAPSIGNSPAFGRPTSFYNRRPTTRMGVEWEWRKAFFDAALASEYPELEAPGSDVLRAVLAGNMNLMIQAWTTADIRTAVFLKEEMANEGFGEMRLILDAAAEAWKEPALLVRSSAGVVLPPFPAGGRGGEGSMMAWNVGRLLLDQGVPLALSGHGSTALGRTLGSQAGFAMRGGLTFDEALAAVTTTPARMLGIENRVGTMEAGKDADLVLWSGEPFQPTSRVAGVLVGGELILDPRPKDDQ